MSNMDKAMSIIQDKDVIDDEDKVETDPDKMRGHDVVSTGSIMVNHIIGGNKGADGIPQCPGFPKGKITEIYGPESSGKTTLALHACAQAQMDGGSAAFIDFENALAPAWAKKIGVELEDSASWSQWSPKTMEQGFELVEAFIEGGVDIVVVDSIPAMTPEAELEADVSEMNTGGLGLKARKMSNYLKKILNKNRDTALVFINQTRSKISKFGGGGETTPGGNAINFYAALRIRLEALDHNKDKVELELTGEEIKQPIETETEIYVKKTKVSGHQHKKGKFWIRYNQGIDNLRTIIKMAIHNDLVEKSSSWYYYKEPDGGQDKVQGIDNLRNKIVEDDQLRNWMVSEVVETAESDPSEESDRSEGKSDDGSDTEEDEDEE